MTTITIRSGLRKLDFNSDAAGGRTHVVVDFAQAERLAHNQVVRINLGIRDGIERTLEGLPTLVKTEKAAKAAKGASTQELVYRLEGDVA